MKKGKRLYSVIALLAVVGMLLTACQPQIVEVIKEVPVESIVVKEVQVEKIVEVEKEVEKIISSTSQKYFKNPNSFPIDKKKYVIFLGADPVGIYPIMKRIYLKHLSNLVIENGFQINIFVIDFFSFKYWYVFF